MLANTHAYTHAHTHTCTHTCTHTYPECADKLTNCDARVLPQPVLTYSNPVAFDVGTKGAWCVFRVGNNFGLCILLEKGFVRLGNHPLGY